MCAFVKISDLPVIAPSSPSSPTYPLTAGDVMPIVHGNTTFKVELSTLQQYFIPPTTLSAAGSTYQVQFYANGFLSADPGFLYIQPLSSIQVGYNNNQGALFGGILGGQFNTNTNQNTFILGSNIASNVSNYTLVNNLSSQFLVAAGDGGNSRGWGSAFVYTNAQSARLSQPSLDSRYLVLTGGTLSGNLTVLGLLSTNNLSANNINVNNLTVNGNEVINGSLTVTQDLSVFGNLAYLDTTVSVTSSLSVVNFGTSPALTVEQFGNTPIAIFKDPTGSGFVEITSTGQVGVNTSSPNNAVTVVGNVSATGLLYGAQAGINTNNPNKALTVVGDISATGTIFGSISGSIPPVSQILYVSPAGNDNNPGTNIYSPLKTIKKACQIVSQNQQLFFPVTQTIGVPAVQYTIMLLTGTYTEQNPVYVPEGTSIIGDNLRRVSIYPANPTYDIFWFNSGCYMWGVTFRGHLAPSAACAFPNLDNTQPYFNIAFNYPGYEIAVVGANDYYRTCKPYIINSPYMQGSTSYATSIQAPQQTILAQTISATPAFNTTALSSVQSEFNNLIQITLQGAVPQTLPLNLSAVPANATTAVNILANNRSTIQSAITSYISTTYPSLFTTSYQNFACYRDAGYMIDCIEADLQSGSNARIVEAANIYYIGTLSGTTTPPSLPLPADEIYVPVWNWTAGYVNTYLSAYPAAATYVHSEFAALTGILSNGYQSVPINYVSTPTNDQIKAARLIYANRSFFQTELTAYINNTYVGWQYNKTTAAATLTAKQRSYRDTGWLIDALTYDLLSGTNARMITYANAFNLGLPVSRLVNDEYICADSFSYGEYLASYIVGNSAVQSASAGCGIRVDGSLARGFLRSFVTDSFTQVNQGGYGIHITNNGYASLVSTFTICCSIGVYCNNGGTCSINTSNCTFGLSGLVADGYSPYPVLSGIVTNNVGYNSFNFTVSGLAPRFDPPDYLNEPVPINAPYQGLCYRISNDSTNTLYYVASAILIDPVNYVYNLQNANFTTASVIASGGIAKFYITSQIATGSHTFEYVGTGTNLAYATPAIGGVTNIANPDNEARSINGGYVFFTSTNQLGNFKVGNGFTILQATGTIQGITFQRAILALVTPLSLALE